jgi:hypothetical protein
LHLLNPSKTPVPVPCWVRRRQASRLCTRRAHPWPRLWLSGAGDRRGSVAQATCAVLYLPLAQRVSPVRPPSFCHQVLRGGSRHSKHRKCRLLGLQFKSKLLRHPQAVVLNPPFDDLAFRNAHHLHLVVLDRHAGNLLPHIVFLCGRPAMGRLRAAATAGGYRPGVPPAAGSYSSSPL